MRVLRARRPRGRPRKTLEELVRDRSFLARRHDGLLAGDDVEDSTLAALQALYRQAGDDRQRRRVALQFEKLVREVAPVVELDVEPPVEFEEPLEAAESQMEMMARIWGQLAPWSDTSSEDGHAFTNRPMSPGGSRPPVGPPSGES